MITLQQWNRTLLARQHLLERIDEDVIEVLDRCVGLQAQDPRTPFVALWSRIEGFDPADYDDLLVERDIVRMVLLRGTLMTMDAEDARWVRALAQPRITRTTATNHHKTMPPDVDPHDVVTAAADALAHGPLGIGELRELLSTRWPSAPGNGLTAIARAGLPLVQVPPRGTWTGTGEPTYALFDQWAGPGEPAVVDDEARRDLIRMYLRGFGPASIAGIQTWSGLTGLGSLVKAMVDEWELTRVDGPAGEELYDLDGLPIADGDEPAPVRLIAPFDHILVAQAASDRRRVADPARYAKTVTPNGRSPGFLLVDGWLAGTWKVDGEGVLVDYFGEVDVAHRRAVDEEAERLAEFLVR